MFPTELQAQIESKSVRRARSSLRMTLNRFDSNFNNYENHDADLIAQIFEDLRLSTSVQLAFSIALNVVDNICIGMKNMKPIILNTHRCSIK